MVMESVNPEPQLILVGAVLKSCMVKIEYIMKKYNHHPMLLEKASSKDIKFKG